MVMRGWMTSAHVPPCPYLGEQLQGGRNLGVCKLSVTLEHREHVVHHPRQHLFKLHACSQPHTALGLRPRH